MKQDNKKNINKKENALLKKEQRKNTKLGKNFLKTISTRDKNEFKKWIKNSSLFFGNDNFITGLVNINLENKLPKNIIEFSLYNHFILKNRYTFDFVKFRELIKNNEITSMKEIFSFYHGKNLATSFVFFWDFYEDLIKYYINKSNSKEEYELLELYWEFISVLKNKRIVEFNNWIIYINKNIYLKQIGFKRKK